MSKKAIWFEVAEGESIAACLERMKQEGYMPAGRKEEPLFKEVNGEPVPVRQIVKFKGVPIQE